jgi:hypothetical protein
MIFLIPKEFIEEKPQITGKIRVISPTKKPNKADHYKSAQIPYEKIMVAPYTQVLSDAHPILVESSWLQVEI